MAHRSPSADRLPRALRYRLEAAGATLVFGFFRLLPVDLASGLGGWLGRTVGPHLGITRRARRNIARALPELAPALTDTVIRDMWDNLGRVVAEYPHLEKIAASPEQGGRVTVEDWTWIDRFRDGGPPCILFSGHFANWEVFALFARRTGMDYAQVYRAPNNPWVDTMMRHVRGLADDDIVPKGVSGARKSVALIKAGRRLGMLVDQKMNDGIAVPFFGHDAMTAPALAQLAFRFGCAAVPARIERTGGCHFRVTVCEPLAAPDTGDRHRDVALMMAQANRLFESWIRERPGQWLWLHNRWPDE